MRKPPPKIIPCKNCLCFPVCMSEFITIRNSRRALLSDNYICKSKFISYVWNKCALAKDYISRYKPAFPTNAASEHGSWRLYEYFKYYK
jgi:hypothetical protein